MVSILSELLTSIDYYLWETMNEVAGNGASRTAQISLLSHTSKANPEDQNTNRKTEDNKWHQSGESTGGI